MSPSPSYVRNHKSLVTDEHDTCNLFKISFVSWTTTTSARPVIKLCRIQNENKHEYLRRKLASSS